MFLGEDLLFPVYFLENEPNLWLVLAKPFPPPPMPPSPVKPNSTVRPPGPLLQRAHSCGGVLLSSGALALLLRPVPHSGSSRHSAPVPGVQDDRRQISAVSLNGALFSGFGDSVRRPVKFGSMAGATMRKSCVHFCGTYSDIGLKCYGMTCFFFFPSVNGARAYTLRFKSRLVL